MVFVFNEMNNMDMVLAIYDCRAKGFLFIKSARSNISVLKYGTENLQPKINKKFSEFINKILNTSPLAHLTTVLSEGNHFLTYIIYSKHSPFINVI